MVYAGNVHKNAMMVCKVLRERKKVRKINNLSKRLFHIYYILLERRLNRQNCNTELGIS